MAASRSPQRRQIVPIQKPKFSEQKDRVERGRTFSWNEIPKWAQDNEYILTGYRALVIQSVFSN